MDCHSDLNLFQGRPPLQDKDRLVGRNMPRPTTWIPADVWIKQGMEAREMTLPLGLSWFHLALL